MVFIRFLQNRKNIWYAVLLLILCIPAIYSLLQPGFFQSDDGEWMIIRFSAFHEALRDGQFPPRLLGRLNHEYGYPVTNFLYPGYLYLSEIPKLIGFDFTTSVKIIFAFSILISGIFCFAWLLQIFNRVSAMLGALFYVYFPYHLYDLYHRGSIGEVLALAIVPAILWTIEKKYYLLFSFLVGFLILSHNTLAVLFLPFICIYILIQKFSSIQQYLIHFTLGVFLAAFFWMPALYDLQYTIFSEVVVSDFRNYFATEKLIGVSSLVVIGFGLAFIFLRKLKKKHISYYPLLLFFLLMGIGSIFLSISISFWIWNYLPVAFIQFPFRVLSLTILAVSFLAAYIHENATGLYRSIILSLWIIIVVFTSVFFIKPALFFDKGDPYYATNQATTTVKNEYMPKWVQKAPTTRPENLLEIVKGTGSFTINSKKTNYIDFQMNNQTETVLQINKVYFPGWSITVDKKKHTPMYNNEYGLIQISVPSGEHAVLVRFEETQERLFADSISVITFFGLVIMHLRRKK